MKALRKNLKGSPKMNRMKFKNRRQFKKIEVLGLL